MFSYFIFVSVFINEPGLQLCSVLSFMNSVSITKPTQQSNVIPLCFCSLQGGGRDLFLKATQLVPEVLNSGVYWRNNPHLDKHTHGSSPSFPVSANDERSCVWEMIQTNFILHYKLFSPEWVVHDLSNIKGLDEVRIHCRSPTNSIPIICYPLMPRKLWRWEKNTAI